MTGDDEKMKEQTIGWTAPEQTMGWTGSGHTV